MGTMLATGSDVIIPRAHGGPHHSRRVHHHPESPAVSIAGTRETTTVSIERSGKGPPDGHTDGLPRQLDHQTQGGPTRKPG
jgi:hypothetical protein